MKKSIELKKGDCNKSSVVVKQKITLLNYRNNFNAFLKKLINKTKKKDIKKDVVHKTAQEQLMHKYWQTYCDCKCGDVCNCVDNCNCKQKKKK